MNSLVILFGLIHGLSLISCNNVNPVPLNGEGLERCDIFPNRDRNPNYRKYAGFSNTEKLIINVSNRPTHQLISRIFAYFVSEEFGFNVTLTTTVENERLVTENGRILRILQTINGSAHHPESTTTRYPLPNVDLELWMTSGVQINSSQTILDEIEGKFGWFIPTSLTETNKSEMVPFTLFLNPDGELEKFVIPDDVLTETVLPYIEPKTKSMPAFNNGVYIPPRCRKNTKCGYLLAPYFDDTHFVIDQIESGGYYLKVIFLGKNLQLTIDQLLHQNEINKFKILFVYWTPSNVINSTRMDTAVIMPHCQLFDPNFQEKFGCKYDSTQRVKMISPNITESVAGRALKNFMIESFNFDGDELQDLYNIFMRETKNAQLLEVDESTDENAIVKIYNSIACTWLKNFNNRYKWRMSFFTRRKKVVMLEMLTPNREDIMMNLYHLNMALGSALSTINESPDILPEIRLQATKEEFPSGMDSSFVKVHNIISSQVERNIWGILGPPYSDNVEDLAGWAPHFHQNVISYSAEGAIMDDRKKYGTFFRTIGENRQYENVYINIFEHFGWKRVATIMQDGEKYAEYLSNLEDKMTQKGIENVASTKISGNMDNDAIELKIKELISKNARILIADLPVELSKRVLCHAINQNMTSENGYVWFLPSYAIKLSLDAYSTTTTNATMNAQNIECSPKDYAKFLEGTFSISHIPYANDTDVILPEYLNITVADWRSVVFNGAEDDGSIDDYAGYLYDAIWTFAIVFDRLTKENPNALQRIADNNFDKDKTANNKLTKYLWEMDMNGVSGRIKFGPGGSRYSSVRFVQILNNTSNIVGRFDPVLTTADNSYTVSHWKSYFFDDSIEWFGGNQNPPDDGRIICIVEPIAQFIGLDCSETLLSLLTLAFLFVILVTSGTIYLCWKHRYDNISNQLNHTLEESEKFNKYMKILGLDLISPSRLPDNALEIWEIPKAHIVINRKLGEGAFGTVFGGEARIGGDKTWTAVAVKTLKANSSTDDRLDFLAEAESMKRFQHKNIIKLLAVCVKQGEPIYTIMEFMLYGDLKTYLLARRHLVNEKNTEDSDFSPKRLTSMAQDVARALAYLSEKKFVHRDIACRNCLVSEQRVVKLGDFGMARPTFENDYYRFNRKGMLPVRWMAPESLALGLFTPASDIWSFGVLLYEMITFGSFPYQGLSNNQVLEYVKSGNILTIPAGVKSNLEGLIKSCWRPQSKLRPTAKTVCDFISNYPRLLSPCLDMPLASVEIDDSSDSNGLEIPTLQTQPRKKSTVSQIDSISKSTLNNLDSKHSYTNTNPSYQMANVNVLPDTLPIDLDFPHLTRLTTYNPSEPLLYTHSSDNSRSSSSLNRYMPMHNFDNDKIKSASLDRNYYAKTSAI